MKSKDNIDMNKSSKFLTKESEKSYISPLKEAEIMKSGTKKDATPIGRSNYKI
jgi:hypothetical protein